MSLRHRDISYDLINGIYNAITKEVHSVTLSGLQGSLTITSEGLSKIATFDTTLTITATNFVTNNYDDYLAIDVLIWSEGAVIYFAALNGSFNLPTTAVTVSFNYTDFFLPSRDELQLIHTNLYSQSVGGITGGYYASSSEIDATSFWSMLFNPTGIQTPALKSAGAFGIRAVHTFTTDVVYNLRDVGVAGGLIFHIVDNGSTYTYYEAAPADSVSTAWSNIQNAAVTGTSVTVGSGASNNTKIIAQSGHTASCASVCDAISIVATLNLITGTVADATFPYPVFKSVPKIAPNNYVWVGGVIQTENGTKDEFLYEGTVIVRVTTDRLARADKKLCQNIINQVRGLLKPNKAAVFTLDGSKLVVFSHESMNEMEEQTENILKISLVDIYNFLIQ